MKMKKFLLLSASMLALSGITPVVSINAQNNDVGTVAISQEQTSELRNAFDEAVSLYQSYYPNAELTDIDIHMHQETGQFITRILGRGETEAYQLIRYNGENFFASKSRDDDDDNLAINIDELASIEEITQSVMDHTQNNNIVNWSLDSDDDDDNDTGATTYSYTPSTGHTGGSQQTTTRGNGQTTSGNSTNNNYTGTQNGGTSTGNNGSSAATGTGNTNAPATSTDGNQSTGTHQ